MAEEKVEAFTARVSVYRWNDARLKELAHLCIEAGDYDAVRSVSVEMEKRRIERTQKLRESAAAKARKNTELRQRFEKGKAKKAEREKAERAAAKPRERFEDRL